MLASVLTLLILISLSGCATMAREVSGPPVISARVLPGNVQGHVRPATAEELHQAEQVVSQARHIAMPGCSVPIAIMEGSKEFPALATYFPSKAQSTCDFTILVPLSVFSLPRDVQQAIFAHELGHVINGDRLTWRQALPVRQKELEADMGASVILSQISKDACLAQVQGFWRYQEMHLPVNKDYPTWDERIMATTMQCNNMRTETTKPSK